MSDHVGIRLSRPLKGVRVQGVTLDPWEGPSVWEGEATGPEGEAVGREAYEAGFAAASAEWTSRFSEVLRSLDRESALLNACRRDFMASLEKSVVDLGVAVAEKFLISERERRRYAIGAIVHSILERLDDRKGGKLVVALNPADVEALNESGGGLEEEAFQSIRIVEDPAVPLAGCRLDTGLGRVAYSLEEQLEEIRRILTEMEVPEGETSDP